MGSKTLPADIVAHGLRYGDDRFGSAERDPLGEAVHPVAQAVGRVAGCGAVHVMHHRHAGQPGHRRADNRRPGRMRMDESIARVADDTHQPHDGRGIAAAFHRHIIDRRIAAAHRCKVALLQAGESDPVAEVWQLLAQ